MSQKIKPATEMMIKAGLIPKDLVQQMVQTGQLPPEAAELCETEPLPESKEDRIEWAQELAGCLDDQEVEAVRETVLDEPGDPVAVLVYKDLERAQALMEPFFDGVALRDPAGRFTFDIDDIEIEAGNVIQMRGAEYDSRVVEVEQFYEEEEPRFLLCTVENIQRR